MIRKRYWLGLLVFLITSFSGCSLDDGGTQISCGFPPDGSLFENAPEDTVFIIINSDNSHFNRTFKGERREVQLGNPVEGNYTNLFTYQREPASGTVILKGLGTTILNESDSTNVTIAFNFQENSFSDKVCRMNKTLQSDHEFSEWNRNKQGAEVRVTLKIDGEWKTFSSDGLHQDGFILDLEQAELLDEFSVYTRIKGTFTTDVAQVIPETANPLKVHITGSFIINIQAG